MVSLLHHTAHFAKHATDVTVREKNVKRAPEIIAPITLVATNSIAKRTTDVKIAPRIPVKSTGSTAQTHPLLPVPLTTAANIGVNARYTTAIPRTTHKNAGVIVITAVMRSIAVITPTIKLAIIESTEQLFLHSQFKRPIIFTPLLIIYEDCDKM